MIIYPHRGFGCLDQEHPGPARIVLIHDDAAFSDALTARLEALGHEVEAFDDLTISVPAARPSEMLEIAIIRPRGPRGELRIKALGIPEGRPYSGPLLKVLVDPITVTHVAEALNVFLQ